MLIFQDNLYFHFVKTCFNLLCRGLPFNYFSSHCSCTHLFQTHYPIVSKFSSILPQILMQIALFFSDHSHIMAPHSAIVLYSHFYFFTFWLFQMLLHTLNISSMLVLNSFFQHDDGVSNYISILDFFQK